MRQLEKSIRRKLGRRRFHAYCVGAAKTGTTTIAKMLSHRYLAAHEPETVLTNRLVIGYLSGDRDENSLRSSLVSRDRRLGLELDSSHPLAYVSPVLQSLFPDAQFVVTVREPFSWLRSRLNYHKSTDPQKWREYRKFFWHDKHDSFPPQEAPLEPHDLVSLDTYLAQYAEHYRLLLDQLDWNRALVIRTSELSASAEPLAAFLDIPTTSVLTTHAKQGRPDGDLMSSLDERYVRAAILRHCRAILERWFPEAIGDYL